MSDLLQLTRGAGRDVIVVCAQNSFVTIRVIQEPLVAVIFTHDIFHCSIDIESVSE